MRRAAKVLLWSMVVVCAVWSWTGAYADPPFPKPSKGKGRYVMVLWESGTPIPGSRGEYMKDVPAPDLVQFGGQVLRSKDTTHFLIDLPIGRAKELRRHHAVAYLQRLWMGEPVEELADDPYGPNERGGIQTDTDLTWGPKDYAYDGSGNITQIGADNYTYDSAGRLIRSMVSGKTETFKYDAFGNMTEQTRDGATVSIPVDGSSNRLAGVGYDAAGNVTSRGGAEAYTYDSLKMLTSYNPNMQTGFTSNARRMIYDANDERIGMTSGSSTARWWIRDFEGRVLREFMGIAVDEWTWEQDYLYVGGQVVAGETLQWSIDNANGSPIVYGGVRHYHLDHLGSVRLVTNAARQVVSADDYDPHGVATTPSFQEPINAGDAHVDARRFAGHERVFLGPLNIESSDYLDYMHARYYDPNVGRFLSVDPVLDVETALRRPQTWNRYGYVANNPINSTDPSGGVLVSSTGQNTLLDIAGPAAANIAFRQDGSIDTTQLTQQDLTGNEGALLLRQMAVSTSVYTYEEGNTAQTAGGTQKVSGVLNLDGKPADIILPNGNPLAKGPARFPVAGVNGAVTVDPSVQYRDAATGTHTVPTRAIVFHELAESYAKVENNMLRGPDNGPGAHFVSRLREVILMMQRPNWTPYPAGGNLKR